MDQRIPQERFFVLAAMWLIVAGCNHSFSPKGPFQQQLVVYSILCDEREKQYVRVYSTYDVQGFDPLQNETDMQISDAQVTMIGPTGSYAFKDTLIARSDTSHYKSPIVAYVSNFRVQRGETYSLAVNVPGGGSSSASITIPDKLLTFTMWLLFDLDDPGDIRKVLHVYVVGQSTPLTRGYAGQMLIQFSVLTASGWQDKQVEVPADEPDFSATNRVIERSNDYGSVSFLRSNVAYVNTLNMISQRYKDTRISFKRIVFRLLQVEKNMYDYYKIVHGFQDPYTIRFDQPDFTNLNRGFGLFGGCTIDTLIHDYPAHFGYNH
jgi:hypothetical protein